VIPRCAVSWALAAIAAAGLQADSSEAPSVGMAVTVRDLVLPGTELEVRPPALETPVVVRVAAVHPHGSAFRYDLVWYGLEPGEYDLGDFLRRRDGSTTEDLPPLPISVRALLGEGRVQPHPLSAGRAPSLGGYRALLGIAAALWLVGLVWLLRGRRRRAEELAFRARPATLSEQLRPLVAAAVDGTLPPAKRAELELALVAFWRERLSLEDVSAAEVWATLRSHPEAGVLVRGLEDWLHRPRPASEVDLAALLAPYRDLPAEEGASAPVVLESRS
jgi:hypothetical protein